MLRSSITRAAGLASSRSAITATRVSSAALNPLSSISAQQTRQAHAISNPTLADIEKRWEAMPPQEQADLWMALRDRMKVDWHELTIQEKKAAYWIAFGPHGPRAQTPPGENAKVFAYTLIGCGAAAVLFLTTRYFARPPPKTMNKEYQEQSDEYLKEANVEPITGISNPEFKGRFSVQSKPKDRQ
ncbi:cytochrome c oxidase subunit IV [Myriangium duriaei CBS 260.36]|uniref:Cytochrome c oxidase polypeptide V n=1 Tax=Myriangium duriaei CBS 260.36 TaxID=1168546 RepID=A0A9P4J9D8_9PEZI|nr:cytochrome c oxidase subunit IV [Myriangium duriaei CBS 260.36]